MINVEDFEKYLNKNGVEFFTGVPDSQLSSFCDYIEDKYGIGDKHIIAVNEGNAVALASGYYLSTGKYPLVYLQNSGLGNIVNPVTSLTHPKVYSVPMIFLVGWRGEPGIKDEPQHIKQGEITLDLLELLDIEYKVITKNTSLEDIKTTFKNDFLPKLENGNSVSFVVSKGAFENFKTEKSNSNSLTREIAIQTVVDNLNNDDMIISTTGKTSRELFEYREEKNQGHGNDFLTVGSMGHSSILALGVAINNPNKKVFCFDGDGAVLMHMGALATIGSKKQHNLYHILFNNSAHESVGGLPTIMDDINIIDVANDCGYNKSFNASNLKELKEILPKFINEEGPVLLNIKTNIKSRKDLGRPTTTPIENKNDFMEKLSK